MNASHQIRDADKRAALEEVLTSATFVRASQVRNFLRYICEMELAGRGATLHEYLIGVEALGRPTAYSTEDDSSVRRRAYALRQKLDEVYAKELADAQHPHRRSEGQLRAAIHRSSQAAAPRRSNAVQMPSRERRLSRSSPTVASSPCALASHPCTHRRRRSRRRRGRPKRERLAWFHEAKYGLFIHWGLYAIPAGEWKGKRIPGIGEWIMNRAQIPVREYEQLAKQFNPVKFNADDWVQLAKDAGMKYIVITSKHHDGFALYDSKVSTYDIVDATPFKRDMLKELAGRVREAGHAARVLLLAVAGLARAQRRGQRLGLRARLGPDKKERKLRQVPAREGGAAGPRAAHRATARWRWSGSTRRA